MKTEQLVQQYADDCMEKVFYFALKHIGNQQKAEDVTSNISVCILSQLQKGNEPKSMPAWIWQIARN